MESVADAQSLREVSQQLRDTAVNTATNIEEGTSHTVTDLTHLSLSVGGPVMLVLSDILTLNNSRLSFTQK